MIYSVMVFMSFNLYLCVPSWSAARQMRDDGLNLVNLAQRLLNHAIFLSCESFESFEARLMCNILDFKKI